MISRFERAQGGVLRKRDELSALLSRRGRLPAFDRNDLRFRHLESVRERRAPAGAEQGLAGQRKFARRKREEIGVKHPRTGPRAWLGRL